MIKQFIFECIRYRNTLPNKPIDTKLILRKSTEGKIIYPPTEIADVLEELVKEGILAQKGNGDLILTEEGYKIVYKA